MFKRNKNITIYDNTSFEQDSFYLFVACLVMLLKYIDYIAPRGQ
jgi:hypothetical protein